MKNTDYFQQELDFMGWKMEIAAISKILQFAPCSDATELLFDVDLLCSLGQWLEHAKNGTEEPFYALYDMARDYAKHLEQEAGK